ncbi:hypothetical protein [Mycolicibacterium fallax]|uniref:Uncharacterized protein n=1 Tax=Mycolicibacterium fallax TaxID=1793 RepID=A0A1X1RDC8_MYCFA|nr:hypothetical protein [Mycolicibacterium fallax]ORV03156.1 hypothetical protein AWC04_11015 [Mycolicibacterium fallax]BBY98843.1 hypothetical protein MFAL_23100 [Mycolicibacterium fallax]HOW93485.1 hypothetical protein [Mycolicibacterium fallax]HSA40013.1 hypothetical protein [Mycobacterium sp.]
MDVLRGLLKHQFTVAELIGLAVLLATPYLVIGVLWVATHTDRLPPAGGVRLVFSVLASVLAWPVLLLSHACPV